MTFEFTVFSVLTTFASGNSRWICSAEAVRLRPPRRAVGSPGRNRVRWRRRPASFPARFSWPAACSASRDALPFVQLKTSSPCAAASANGTASSPAERRTDQHVVTELVATSPAIVRPTTPVPSTPTRIRRECRFIRMKRVRFAPSPTGSLHVGNALSAVANRDFGDWFLLRIDDTDAARNVPGGEEEILRDLEWLGVAWDEGPIRQSERQELYREAAERARRRPLRKDHAPPRGRHRDLPPGQRRRRHRVRDHARHPRQRPSAERDAPSRADRRAGCDASGVRASRPDPRRGRAQAVEARVRLDRGLATGRRASRPKPSAATSTSSASRSTTCITTSRASGGSRSRRSRP